MKNPNVGILKNGLNGNNVSLDGLVSETTLDDLKKLLCDKVCNVIANKGGFNWAVSVQFPDILFYTLAYVKLI